MERHFHEQLETLRKRLLEMAGLAEQAIAQTLEALVQRDDALAQAVVDADEAIDRLEVQVDELCLRLLATQQPMAVDLRFITSAMKINNDLERIGDHAVNIAQYTRVLNQSQPLGLAQHLPHMAAVARAMVGESLRCFVTGDADGAKALCQRDDEVDRMDAELTRKFISSMMADATAVERALHLTLISKNLERIADLATNIAEEVVFIVQAQSVKHQTPPPPRG